MGSDEEITGSEPEGVELVGKHIIAWTFIPESDKEAEISDFSDNETGSLDDDLTVPTEAEDLGTASFQHQIASWLVILLIMHTFHLLTKPMLLWWMLNSAIIITAIVLFGFFFTDQRKGRKHVRYDSPEIKTWFGLLLAMGIFPKGHLRD